MSRDKEELDIQELNRQLLEELERAQKTGDEGKPSRPGMSAYGRKHLASRHRAGARLGREGWEENREGAKKKHKQKSGKPVSPIRVLLAVLCVAVCLVTASAGAIIGLKVKGQKQLQQSKVTVPITAPEEVQVDEEGKYVIYKNRKYCYNEDILTILCMGVDQSIEETSEETIGENGQADTLVLFVLDKKTGSLTLLNIPRDTMVDVNKYNVQGQFLSTEKMQICLAYAYGDGKGKSCVNTMESVSRLMYGMPVHGYAAIDLDSISVLNDAVGGVTVEILEDLSYADAQLTVGNVVTLRGNQAHIYVRSRDVEKLDSNNNRMERQKQYLQAFMKTALEKTRQDLKMPLMLYQAAGDYMVTDMGASEITYLASLVLKNGVEEGIIKSVPGQVVKGEIYAEYHPDDESLYEMILDTFYKEENET